MKKISILLFASIVLLGLKSCTTDDDVVFVVQPPSENVNFTNQSFASEYLISDETGPNTAETFIWNTPDFGVPTPLNYVLEGSITQLFETVDYSSGTINETNKSVTVNDLLAMAELLGLDDESNTEGVVHFRVRAFVGGDGSDEESTSDIISLNIKKLEVISGGAEIEITDWGIVGSAYNDWGNAGPDAVFYTTDQPNIFVSYVTLKDGEMKIREGNDWAVNYGDDGADGTLDLEGANIITTAGTYKVVFNLNDLTYTIEQFSWGIVGDAFNEWGDGGPDAQFLYDYTTDTWKLGVKLFDGEFKFRFNNDWTLNMGDDGGDGTLEEGGANIAVSQGNYQLSLNLNDNTYTIAEADIYGVVGSAYNDWGGEGPDFAFTEVNTGIYIIDAVTLLDGEMKFRQNNDWAINYGDDDADGTLELDGANIVTTAGTYRIVIDFSTGSPTYTIY